MKNVPMQFSSIILALAGVAFAQRPNGTSICDYYTTALLKDNNSTNQLTLLELVVNTAVIGNYTKPNVGIAVPGILAKGKYNGVDVNLLPYFNGALASTNSAGKAVSKNFLDDGGAAPLLMNKPSNGTSSAQYLLLTHLYQYFGLLLGCSTVGTTGFPAYGGGTSMYQVHRFMALDVNEVGYFITQVGLAAASFGVSTADVTAVGMALNNAFGYRCAPPLAVLPKTSAELQAICIADNCPISPNATCASYQAVVKPVNATGNATVSATMSASATSTTRAAATANGAAAVALDYQTSAPMVAVVAGIAALAFAF